jgi:hypothetical protein
MGDAETRQMQTDEPLHSFPCPLAATTLTPPTRKGKRERQKGTFYFTWVLDLLIRVDATNIESITRWVCLPCPKSGQWPQ